MQAGSVSKVMVAFSREPGQPKQYVQVRGGGAAQAVCAGERGGGASPTSTCRWGGGQPKQYVQVRGGGGKQYVQVRGGGLSSTCR